MQTPTRPAAPNELSEALELNLAAPLAEQLRPPPVPTLLLPSGEQVPLRADAYEFFGVPS